MVHPANSIRDLSQMTCNQNRRTALREAVRGRGADILYALKVIRTAFLQLPCDLHTHFHETKKSYAIPKKMEYSRGKTLLYYGDGTIRNSYFCIGKFS